MTEHKIDIDITKIDKYKKNNNKKQKLNSTSMTEHKTDVNITNIEKYKTTEHDRTQNRKNLSKIEN